MKAICQWLWKWLICSWVHRKHRCYPVVWGPEVSEEMGIPYRPNQWHCKKCHPCSEGIDDPYKDDFMN